MLLSSDAEDICDALARTCALRSEDVQVLQHMCCTRDVDAVRERHYLAHVSREFAARERWRCARERDALRALRAWQCVCAAAYGDDKDCCGSRDKGGDTDADTDVHAACGPASAASLSRERAHALWWSQLGAYASTCAAQLRSVHALCADDLVSSPFASLPSSHCLYARACAHEALSRTHAMYFTSSAKATMTTACSRSNSSSNNGDGDDSDDTFAACSSSDSGTDKQRTLCTMPRHADGDEHVCRTTAAASTSSSVAELQRWRKQWRVLLFLYTQAWLSLRRSDTDDGVDDDSARSDAKLRSTLRTLPVRAADELLQQQRQVFVRRLQSARTAVAAATTTATM